MQLVKLLPEKTGKRQKLQKVQKWISNGETADLFHAPDHQLVRRQNLQQ